MPDLDTIIVGYGPTGKLLAKLLADAGHKIAVVERWEGTYSLPRAIAFFHDAARMFRSLGLWDRIAPTVRPFDQYTWFDKHWGVLVNFDHGEESPSGGPGGFTFSQPDLETVFDDNLAVHPNVTLIKGHDAIEVGQTDDEAQVRIAPYSSEFQRADTARSRLLTARYLVGCDGANSRVRAAIGGAQIDLGFDARWLVVDIRPDDLTAHDIPDSAQWCNPDRPTTIVPSGLTMRRWEFMMKPDDDEAAFTSDENIWSMVSRWIRPDQGTLVRKALYRFQSLIASRWRAGRVLIAGDAAHLMPPFMGQGMGSGLRDAWDLAWQLDLVLRGVCRDTLLDAYQAERMDHVRQMIVQSMEMGRVVCTLDADEARQRDAQMRRGTVHFQGEPPKITDGVVARNDRLVAPGAGEILPHVRLKKPDGAIARMDAITGRAFVIIAKDGADHRLTGRQMAQLKQIGAAILPLGAGGFADQDGRLDACLADHEAVALIARPDFHAFGFAKSAEDLSGLVDQLLSGLHLAVA